LKITVNGKQYEIPDGTDLKLREAQIVESYCSGNLAGDGYSISKAMGLIHVAIKRAEPNVPDVEIRESVEELDLSDLPQEEEAGQSPPASGRFGLAETPKSDGSPDSEPFPVPIPKDSGTTNSGMPSTSVHAT
jgi:hypothetical protein